MIKKNLGKIIVLIIIVAALIVGFAFSPAGQDLYKGKATKWPKKLENCSAKKVGEKCGDFRKQKDGSWKREK